MQYREFAIRAVDSLFNMYGQKAEVTFDDDTSAELLTVHRLPDKNEDIFESSIRSSCNMFDFKKAEIPKPVKSVKKGEVLYSIKLENIADEHGLILRLEAYED